MYEMHFSRFELHASFASFIRLCSRGRDLHYTIVRRVFTTGALPDSTPLIYPDLVPAL